MNKHWSLDKLHLVRQTYGTFGTIQRYLMPHGVIGRHIIEFAEGLEYAYQGLNKIPDYILLHNLKTFLAVDCQYLR